MAGFMCQMPVIFHKSGTLTYVVQYHLVKSLGGKYFINYQSVSWLANSKCASMKKLYEAAGA